MKQIKLFIFLILTIIFAILSWFAKSTTLLIITLILATITVYLFWMKYLAKMIIGMLKEPEKFGIEIIKK